jgi:hypothetical protein
MDEKTIEQYTREEFDEVLNGITIADDNDCDNISDRVVAKWCESFDSCMECYRAIIERLMRERQHDHDCVWVVSRVYGEGNRIIDRVFTSQESVVEYLRGKTLTLDLTLKDTGGASLRYDYADYSGCYIDAMPIPSYVITRYELNA